MINRAIPSLNGQHDPAESEKKKMIHSLREKARASSKSLWFGVAFTALALTSLLALILSIVAISK